MSLDLHIHAEVDVGIFLSRGHRGVLHWIQINTVQICRRTNRTRDHLRIIVGVLWSETTDLRPQMNVLPFTLIVI